MFNGPPCRLRRGGFVLGPRRSIADTRHNVEAPTSGPTRLVGIGIEPGVGASAKSALLAVVDGFCGETVTLEKIIVASGFETDPVSSTPALHLDKHERGTASGDEVDLDAIRADVACDDAIPSRFEE